MIKLKIATPERVVYENEINQVSIPTTTGEITILTNHSPLVTVLAAGELKIKENNTESVLAVYGGFVEVRPNNEVIILADKAEKAEEIDLERAEQARKRAIEEMEKAKNRQDVDFAKLQALIDKEINRIKVGSKYKKIKRLPN